MSSPEVTEECDTKTVKALDHILKKWKMGYIPLPIRLVHSDIVSETPMNYKLTNTVIADDSNEFVQFLYNDRKDLRTSHEGLAIMLGFVLVEMILSSKPYRKLFRYQLFHSKEKAILLYDKATAYICYLDCLNCSLRI